MERAALEQLKQWKNNPKKKPLILKGARQVGKTWLMKEFGENCYEDTFYFNFDEEKELISIFESNKEPHRIIELLGLIKNKKILPEKHLIIFDEIQECSEALNSLKYFCEDAKEYHIIAAGSLLGTLLASPKSYPVGKVNLLNISPMTFTEFLLNVNKDLFEYFNSIQKGQKIEAVFHNKLLEAYNYYLIIGGMPECVKSWTEDKDPAEINRIQQELIELYENDFAKHNGKVNSAKILMVFRNIVSQLAKSNENLYTAASGTVQGQEILRKQ